MKIFISWSGERSQKIAELFKDWIQCVIQAAKPWISSHDVDRGALWYTEISKTLADSQFGILCLTPENKTEPWILFEAGALAKGIEENRQIVKNADKRIEQTAEQIKRGIYPKEGLSFIAHIKGLFGQRLWFYRKTIYYTDKLKISDSCIGCGLCSKECPMKNIKMKENRAVPGKRCTMCYRCISLCPQKAITLLGKKVQEQCRLEKYE